MLATSTIARAEESADAIARTRATWRAFVARSNRCEVEVCEARRVIRGDDWETVDAELAPLLALEPTEPGASLAESLRPYLAVLDGKDTAESPYTHFRVARADDRMLLSEVVRGPDHIPMVLLYAPVGSATLAHTNTLRTARVSGPVDAEHQVTISQPREMLGPSGFERIFIDFDGAVREMLDDGDFAAAIASSAPVAVRRFHDGKDVSDQEHAWHADSSVRHERDVAYFPTRGSLTAYRDGERHQFVQFHVVYDDGDVPFPVAMVSVHAFRLPPMADARIHANVVVSLARHVRDIPEDAPPLRIALPAHASITDDTSGFDVIGSSDEPLRWPDHWADLFEPPAAQAADVRLVREGRRPASVEPYSPYTTAPVREADGGPPITSWWAIGLGCGAVVVGLALVLRR